MAQSMHIRFAGFWQCRLSTDPDPTREPRGTSGYTFALPGERDFDRVIKTQRDQIPDAEFRQPFPPYLERVGEQERPFGVFVTGVEGAPEPGIAAALEGAELRLLDDPVFELRNQIVGDGINRIAPPIVPFDLQLGRGDQVLLRRSDPLDPSQPNAEIWHLAPDQFASRVPVAYRHLSDEVLETIFPAASGSANAEFTAYFNRRKQWLTAKVSDHGVDPLMAEGCRTRVTAIDTFTKPPGGSDPGLIVNRLGLQCIWDHPIRGTGAFADPGLAPFVELEQPWHTRFWMGGWDGDLLVGWLQGTLDVPLRDGACESGPSA